MNAKTEDTNSALDILQSYETLSGKSENHQFLIKDKTILLYTASLLEDNSGQIVEQCLRILNNLADNPKTHQAMLATFGLFESLESLSISARRYSKEISQKASQLVEILRASAPTAYGPSRNSIGRIGRKTTQYSTMYQLYVPDLSKDNRSLLDEALLSIKGLVSFVIDDEEKRCTIRIYERVVSLLEVIRRIMQRTDMEVFAIAKNRLTGVQELIEIGERKENISVGYSAEMSDKDEEDKPQWELCENAMSLSKSAGSLLKNLKESWNYHFHW